LLKLSFFGISSRKASVMEQNFGSKQLQKEDGKSEPPRKAAGQPAKGMLAVPARLTPRLTPRLAHGPAQKGEECREQMGEGSSDLVLNTLETDEVSEPENKGCQDGEGRPPRASGES